MAAVVTGAEESSADANPGRTFGNGSFQILTHAHGQRIEGDACRTDLAARAREEGELRALLLAPLRVPGHAHEAAHELIALREDAGLSWIILAAVVILGIGIVILIVTSRFNSSRQPAAL